VSSARPHRGNRFFDDNIREPAGAGSGGRSVGRLATVAARQRDPVKARHSRAEAGGPRLVNAEVRVADRQPAGSAEPGQHRHAANRNYRIGTGFRYANLFNRDHVLRQY
jgi:hypothetical protein